MMFAETFWIYGYILNIGLIAMISVLVVGCGSSRPEPELKTRGHRKARNSSVRGGQSSKSVSGKKSHTSSKSAKSSKSKTSKSKKSKKSKSKSKSKNKSKRHSESQKERPTKSSKDDLILLPKKPSSSSSRSKDVDQTQKSVKTIASSNEMCHEIGKEPRKDLHMEPTELRWNPTGGLQKIHLHNPSDERRAVKVKCSDNNIYRVNPVYSFVEPNQCLTLDIVRQNGGAKTDKMVFVTTRATADDDQPQKLFKSGKPYPMMVLPMVAAK